MSGEPILDQLRKTIENGRPKDAEALVKEALKQGISQVQIMEEAMMPAMREVGDRYKDQDADILSILAAARCIRKGLELIEKQELPLEGRDLGTVILGTVEGDLHDVGKTLVAIMFRSVGLRVIDLGVDISGKQFLKAVRQNPEVKLVCISSLLSTSVSGMEQVVKLLRKNDPNRNYKIMVGGGALTKELADAMGADAYTENCVEAAEVAKRLVCEGE